MKQMILACIRLYRRHILPRPAAISQPAPSMHWRQLKNMGHGKAAGWRFAGFADVTPSQSEALMIPYHN